MADEEKTVTIDWELFERMRGMLIIMAEESDYVSWEDIHEEALELCAAQDWHSLTEEDDFDDDEEENNDDN